MTTTVQRIKERLAAGFIALMLIMNCGMLPSVFAEGEHNWVNRTQISVATCSTPAIFEYTCSECGARKSVQEGNTDPDAHQWGEWIVDMQPTNTSAGSRHRTCLNNVHHTQSESIPMLSANRVLTLPNALTIIEEEAFYGSPSIDKVVLPQNIKEIHARAFADSTLSEINLPDSLIFISDNAFDGPNKVKVTANQGTYAYNWAVKNGYISSTSPISDFSIGIIKDEDTGENIFAIIKYIGSQSDIIIPEKDGEGHTINAIASNAFGSCSFIDSVFIPDTIIRIDEAAFYKCNNLTSINIPSKVKKIKDNTFTYCEHLKNIVLPSGLVQIGSAAFGQCKSLKNITIPDTVKSIDTFAFQNCTNLSEIILADGLISIGDYAFSFCNSLSYLYIPDSVTNLGKGVVGECPNLLGIHLPQNITSIGDSMFYNCFALSEVNIPSNVTLIDNEAFFHCYSLTELQLPQEIVSIGDLAFYDCNNIERIVLPNKLKNIGSYAFSGCSKLTNTL